MVDPNINDDVQNQQDSAVAVPISSEKGIFAQETNTESDSTNVEEVPIYEVLRKQESPAASPVTTQTDDPVQDTSVMSHVVDLRRKPAVPLPKPIRAILSSADASTKFAADTEQDFITSIKANHGN